MPRKIESGLFSNPMTTPAGGVMLQQGSSEGAGQLADLSKNKFYNSKNPFEWMDMISLQGKANFFERRVGEYQTANVKSGESTDFATDADF